MTKEELGNYYLDLKSLPTDIQERDRVHAYYMDMIQHCEEGRTNSAKTIFNTLTKSEYLKNITIENRDNKLGELIHG